MRALLIETKITPSYQTVGNFQRPMLDNHEPTEADALLQDQKPNPSSSSNTTRYLPILQCLHDSRLLAALFLTSVQALIIGTYDATLTTEAASLFAFTSLESGILFLCLGLPNLILAPLAGYAVDRFGTRPVAVTGFAFLAPSLALLRLPGHQLFARKENLILFYGILTLNGTWLSVASAPGIVAATRVVEEFVAKDPGAFGPKGAYGQLFGLNWLVFNLGLTVGALVGGGLRNAIGYGNMYALVAGITAITAVIACSYLGDRKDVKKPLARAEEL
jgi:MFS family permease